MKLTSIFLEKVKDEEMKMKIGLSAGVKFSTLGKYIREADEKLQLPRIINAIKEHTGMTESEIFELDEVVNQK